MLLTRIVQQNRINRQNLLRLYWNIKRTEIVGICAGNASQSVYDKNRNYATLIQRSIDRNIVNKSHYLVQNLLMQLNVNEKLLQNHLRLFQNSLQYFQRKGTEKNDSLKNSKNERNTSNKNDDNEEDDDDKNRDEKNKDDKKLLFYGVAWVLSSFAFLLTLTTLFPPVGKDDFLRYISWKEFYHEMLAKGEVELIVVKPDMDLVTIYLYPDAIIRGKPTRFRSYQMNIANVPTFEAKLRQAERQLGIRPENSVQILFERNSDNGALSIFIMLAVLGILAYFSKSMTKNRFQNVFRQTKAKFTVIDPLIGGGKGVKFSDVAGLKEAKVEIMEFVDYLKAPEKYKKLGAKVPRGVLLLGPPGCGKTMLAKAIATEASVPFLAMNGSEFIELIGGVGAARVRDLFVEARKRAPCILYIDEIDGIGRKRSSEAFYSSGEEERTLNQLLVEMDGMSQREGIIMLASTNRADILDKALLRPGRFDRHILIDYPTLEERKEIFVQHLSPIKLEKKPEDYATRMAQLTPGFTGADIANVANEAALNAARMSKKIVGDIDLEIAIERVVGGPEKRSGVMNKDDKRVIAFHECGHALVGWLLPHTDALLKVSIVPRTNNVLGFARYLPTDRALYSKDELFDRMCMALGGRVAEQLIFNHSSSGAQDDLKKVTDLAYSQIQVYGMDEKVGLLSFDYENNKFGKKPFSKNLSSLIDAQSRALVAEAYKRTEELLRKNVDKLKLLSEELLKKEVLNYNDFEKLIGPPAGGKKTTVEFFDINSYSDPSIGNRNKPQEDRHGNNNQNNPNDNVYNGQIGDDVRDRE